MYNRNIRPSKEWSVALMIGAIAMCIYGILSVIPSRGVFGVIWTLVAALISVLSGLNAFGKGFSVYQIESGDFGEKRPLQEKSLRIVQRLYEQRLISKEEYEQLRQSIIC